MTVGQTLDGRYVLRRRIGAGGMGVVYEAEHTALERRVAIKVITPDETAADTGFVARFRREAKLASRIAHEHLVEIYDVGSEAGVEYIVMELVEGRDLREELVAGALSYARAVSIARQLLSALAAIHDAGIVHRDIKPANVMLTARGDERDYVKLMDFGVARAAGDAKLTKTGFVVGTPSFMAPEQVRGKEIDHRSDLYAVGVTLFAMLAGRLPFDGNTAAVAGAHVFQAPPSLVSVRPGMPPALAAVVDRALAKSPDDRYPDARAFSAALAAAVAPDVAAAVPLEPATAVERPVRPAAAPSRAPWIAGVIAAAAAGGVVGFLARGESPQTIAPAAVPVATPTAPTMTPPDPPRAPPASEPAAAQPPSTPQPPTPVAQGSASLQPATPQTPQTVKTSVPAGKSAPLFCQCIPTNAPDIYPLCAVAGKPLCRCNSNSDRATTLCPQPLRNRDSCETYLGETTCKKVGDLECPDPRYLEFHTPGTQGDPCSGYLFTMYESDRRDKAQYAGHLDCDACPGTRQDAYRGRPGDACTGFYWRTGEPKAGTLAHCAER